MKPRGMVQKDTDNKFNMNYFSLIFSDILRLFSVLASLKHLLRS